MIEISGYIFHVQFDRLIGFYLEMVGVFTGRAIHGWKWPMFIQHSRRISPAKPRC